MADQAPKDLGPSERLQLSWERGNVVRSLETLFEYITKEAESAINWYLKQKRSKQNRARLLRFCSIIAGTIAGLIPIMGQIFAKNG